MTRDEFNEFLARYLWRTGDTVLEADLPIIIRLGEAKLTRDLKVQRREQPAILTATAQVIPYPDGYHSMRLLSNSDGSWTYATPHELMDRDARGVRGLSYTLTNGGIQLGFAVKPTPTAPATFSAIYYTMLPEWTDAETWVQQYYFDFYLYACLSASAPYLREDDRLPEWEGLYKSTLEDVLKEDAQRQYDGSPLRQKHPGVIA